MVTIGREVETTMLEMRTLFACAILPALAGCAGQPAVPQPVREPVAYPQPAGSVYLGWRVFNRAAPRIAEDL